MFGEAIQSRPMPIASVAMSRLSRQRGHRPLPKMKAVSTIEKNAIGVISSATPTYLYARYAIGCPMRGLLVVYCWCQNSRKRENVAGFACVYTATFHASNAKGSWFTTYAMLKNVIAT